jgi:hypothetical protein
MIAVGSRGRRSRVHALTLDEVLLWVNDRLGMSVQAAVFVRHPRRPYDLVPVLAASGELRFSVEAAPVQAHGARGYYAVGDAQIDLSDIEYAAARERPEHGQIELSLADGVWLVLVEQDASL